MKIFIALLIALLVYFFAPTYDLHGSQNRFDERIPLLASAFLTEKRCEDEARARQLDAFICKPNRNWNRFFSGYLDYTDASGHPLAE